MAVFSQKSRYAKYSETYETTDRRGRRVIAVAPPDVPAATELGEHLRKEGQRLDHLAFFYLSDSCGFWRIALLNGAVLPDSLAEAATLKIPTRF